MSQETGIAPATARNQAGRVRPGRAPESKRPGFMMTAVMLAVLVTPFCVGGQMAATPGGASYARAEIFHPDNSRYEVNDLRIEGDHASFRRGNTNTRSSLLLEDVAAIRVRAGDKGARYAALTAGVSAASAALSVASWNNEASRSEQASYGSWMLGFASFGAGLGYLIGRTQVNLDRRLLE